MNMSQFNYQKDVFSIHQIWDAARENSDEIRRVRDLLNLIPSNIHSILDAGCGGGLVTNNLTYPLVIGIDYSHTALEYVTSPKVEGTLTFIPFDDNAFDLVISSEVLEHIPYFDYERVLYEISRITKQYILITVPWRQVLQKSQVTCPICYCKFQPHYHMRSFGYPEIKTLFEKWGFEAIHISTSGEKRSSIGWKFLIDLFKISKFPQTTICPQCGFSLHPNIRLESENNRVNTTKHKSLQHFIKKIWPKGRLHPRRWMALYQKQQKY